MNSATMIINRMNIWLRKDGRYEGRITVDNKRKCFYGKTKTEVKQKTKDYLLKIDNGYRESQNIILNEYIEYWLSTYKYNKIEPPSYDKLERTYNNQIKNTIGKKKIGEVTTRDVQHLIDEFANPTSDKTRPLAKSGLKRIIHLLNPCYKDAIREGIVYANPCKDIRFPIDSAMTVQTKEQFALSDDEMQLLKEQCLAKYEYGDYKYRNGLVLMIMLNTGVRVGEMLALEWGDINLENRTMLVNKTIQSRVVNRSNDSDKKAIDILKMSPKTKAGIRFIPLNNAIVYYIEELKKYDKRHDIHSPYVCSTRVGTREVARNLQRTLNRVQAKAGIEKHISLHTLRHSFGSALIRNGANISVVSNLMGHANITVTYNKYIHTIKEEEAKAMNMSSIC